MTFQHDQGCHFAIPRDEHGNELPHSDAAKRLSDTYMLHRMANPDAVGKFFGVRISDGTGDGELYPSRAECVRYQGHNAKWFAYVRIQPCDMSVCDAETTIRTHRLHVEATGNLVPSPDREIIPPLTTEQWLRQQADRALGRPSMPIIIGKAK